MKMCKECKSDNRPCKQVQVHSLLEFQRRYFTQRVTKILYVCVKDLTPDFVNLKVLRALEREGFKIRLTRE